MFLIREALDYAQIKADIEILPDGEKAIQMFHDFDAHDAAPCPDLIMLDLNLPKRAGREVLYAIRHSKRCKDVPVLVVTSSNLERDRAEMAELKVNGYFRKPSEYGEFMKLGEIVKGLL